MKKAKIHLSLALFIAGTTLVQGQHPLPFNQENWIIEDANSQARELDLDTLYDRSCLRLPAGHVALFQDSSLLNFRMEMDIAGIAMPGFGFRGADRRNYEYIYLRVICDSQEDALQYLPVFNGGFSWQLYNYPHYEQRISFPKKYLSSIAGQLNGNEPPEKVNDRLKEYLKSGGVNSSEEAVIMQSGKGLWKIIDPKNLSLHYMEQADDSMRIYSGLEWIHVKLEVMGQEAVLYVENMDTPAMVIGNLKKEEAPGLISLRNVWVDSYYANISIEKLEFPAGYKKPEPSGPPPGYLSECELSGKFARNDQNLKGQIDSVRIHTDPWKPIRSEPDGLINLSRYFQETEGTAILRTYIESPVDQQIELLFDYSEHLAVSVNSEIIFSESLRVRKNEGRVMDGEESIPLKLKKGRNELLFVLSADAYHQNWGMIAKIPGLAVP